MIQKLSRDDEQSFSQSGSKCFCCCCLLKRRMNINVNYNLHATSVNLSNRLKSVFEFTGSLFQLNDADC